MTDVIRRSSKSKKAPNLFSAKRGAHSVLPIS